MNLSLGIAVLLAAAALIACDKRTPNDAPLAPVPTPSTSAEPMRPADAASGSMGAMPPATGSSK